MFQFLAVVHRIRPFVLKIKGEDCGRSDPLCKKIQRKDHLQNCRQAREHQFVLQVREWALLMGIVIRRRLIFLICWDQISPGVFHLVFVAHHGTPLRHLYTNGIDLIYQTRLGGAESQHQCGPIRRCAVHASDSTSDEATSQCRDTDHGAQGYAYTWA